MSAPVGVTLLSAGTGDPSSTRLLADRITSKVVQTLRADGHETAVTVIELAPLAADIASALVGGLRSDALEAAISKLGAAEVIVAATPVYKAGISGLFKAFADLLDNDLLIDKTVVPAATAGSARHALVVDDGLRQLFAFFRAITVPTSVFAAPEDWNDPALTTRIARAATEAAVLQAAGPAIRARTWSEHKHEFDSRAGAATGDVKPGTAVGDAEVAPGDDIDFDTDLMRLATGGS